MRVRFTRGADHLLVALPAGITPGTVAAACDSLGHAWGARGVRVRADRPGRVWLDVTRVDTLARPLVLGTVSALVTPAGVMTGMAGLPVGVREDGTSWRLQLRGAHVLIAGTTGSGKSSLLWAIVAGLSTAIHGGLVRVTWLDPKGGMEAAPARPLADVVDRIPTWPTRWKPWSSSSTSGPRPWPGRPGSTSRRWPPRTGWSSSTNSPP